MRVAETADRAASGRDAIPGPRSLSPPSPYPKNPDGRWLRRLPALSAWQCPARCLNWPAGYRKMPLVRQGLAHGLGQKPRHEQPEHVNRADDQCGIGDAPEIRY